MTYFNQHVRPTTHIMSTERLSRIMAEKPPFIVLDASIPMPGETRDCRAEFEKKHIPGAGFLDLKECREKNTDNEYMLPSTEKFTEYIGRFGTLNATKIIIYDANEKMGMFSSPRAWYMFRVFGHREVYVLDGGLKKWISEGRAVESGGMTVSKPYNYEAVYKSHLVKSIEDMKANIDDQKFQVVDARSPGRFNGVAPEPRPDIKPGHIPNAKCLFWTKFLENGQYKTAEQLAEVYKEAGIDPAAPHAATCGTGVTASFIALSSYILGNFDVPVYDGAWYDWYLHAPDHLKVNVPKN